MILEQRTPHEDTAARKGTNTKPILSCGQKSKAKDGRNDRSHGRTIQFHDITSIFWIESAEDMSDEEIEASYYSSRDYLCFRTREKRTYRNFSGWGLMKGRNNEDLIGVETKMQRFHRRQRSKNAIFAVILEQELRQEAAHDTSSSTEEDDDKLIARAYQQYTGESTRLARERAKTNANQVNGFTSWSKRTNGSFTEEVEVEKKKDERPSITTVTFGLPWEVPISSQKKTALSRSADIVKYVSCSHSLLAQNYLGTSYLQDQLDQPEELPEFRHENQSDFQGREAHRGRLRQEAPIRQQIIRSKECNDGIRSTMNFEQHNEYQPSPQYATSEYHYPGTVAQKWIWNPMNCDEGTSNAPVPHFLSWDVH
mmetsp:Transcript_1141/g.2430  ORF Transcript_1141/g.2430 Transcript_1141/m.2430 type:complete len:368 (+) Transcript_1141:226-1329(+)